jgi:chromosome segregation ATPase
MHDALVIGVPVVVILVGILLNRQDATAIRSDLRAEINGLRSDIYPRLESIQRDIDARLDAIHRDMREFYAEQARHDVRINKLEQA